MQRAVAAAETRARTEATAELELELAEKLSAAEAKGRAEAEAGARRLFETRSAEAEKALFSKHGEEVLRLRAELEAKSAAALFKARTDAGAVEIRFLL